MRKLLQTLAISALLLAPASAAHAQISFGIRIGAAGPARVPRAAPTRPRLCVGRGLLVSAGIALRVARRLLDAAAV